MTSQDLDARPQLPEHCRLVVSKGTAGIDGRTSSSNSAEIPEDFLACLIRTSPLDKYNEKTKV